LTTQGRPGDSFYILLEGEANVEVDGKPRPTLKAGDFFGEISMLDRGLASATVTTKTETRLMVMSHAQFRDAIKSSDELLVKVLASMGAALEGGHTGQRPAAVLSLLVPQLLLPCQRCAYGHSSAGHSRRISQGSPIPTSRFM